MVASIGGLGARAAYALRGLGGTGSGAGRPAVAALPAVQCACQRRAVVWSHCARLMLTLDKSFVNLWVPSVTSLLSRFHSC